MKIQISLLSKLFSIAFALAILSLHMMYSLSRSILPMLSLSEQVVQV